MRYLTPYLAAEKLAAPIILTDLVNGRQHFPNRVAVNVRTMPGNGDRPHASTIYMMAASAAPYLEAIRS